MEPTDPELLLGDARSISGGLWRMVWLGQEAAEALDKRVEDEDLDGLVEAVEVRMTLEGVQSLSMELSEELHAYQARHAT